MPWSLMPYLDSLKLPAVLLLVIAWLIFKLLQMDKELGKKADISELEQIRKDLNGVGAKVFRQQLLRIDDKSRFNVAIAAVAVKAGVPEALKDLLTESGKSDSQ
jgi:hypothetical protein